jgi:hypothetical protein
MTLSLSFCSAHSDSRNTCISLCSFTLLPFFSLFFSFLFASYLLSCLSNVLWIALRGAHSRPLYLDSTLLCLKINSLPIQLFVKILFLFASLNLDLFGCVLFNLAFVHCTLVLQGPAHKHSSCVSSASLLFQCQFAFFLPNSTTWGCWSRAALVLKRP